MSIKITRASDPITVEQIITCLASAPGLGKTSTAFTADAPILFDFDGGAHRSQFRKDAVRVGNWNEVENLTASDLAPYKTVSVDTVGRALDVLTAHLIKSNPKLKGYGGALSLQGYGALKTAFVGWLRLIQSFGKDVILLTHMDEQRNGDEIIERLDVQGGSKNEIYKCSDAMGRLTLKGGQRILNFNPTDFTFGKNPAQLDPISVPDYHNDGNFFGRVIREIKDKLNESSESALKEQARLEELKSSFEFLDSPEAFTEKAKAMAGAPAQEKALLVSVAEAKGFAFDKKAKKFQTAAAA